MARREDQDLGPEIVPGERDEVDFVRRGRRTALTLLVAIALGLAIGAWLRWRPW